MNSLFLFSIISVLEYSYSLKLILHFQKKKKTLKIYVITFFSFCSFLGLVSNVNFHSKIENGRKLEALAVQLIILTIWKPVMYICHTYGASEKTKRS